MNHSGDQTDVIIFFALHLFFYPASLAFRKKIDGAGAVLVLNLFGGWTFIGWVIALMSAVKANSRKQYTFDSDNFNFSKKNVSRDRKLDVLVNLADKNQKESQLIQQKLAAPSTALTFGKQLGAIVMCPIVAYITFWVTHDIGFSDSAGGILAVIAVIHTFLYPFKKRYIFEPENRNKMEQQLQFLRSTLAEYGRIYIDLITPDLPHIHALGLMSVDDIRSKVGAVKGSPFLLAYLLNHEVSQGHMESIQTRLPGADQSVIFKSMLNSEPDTRAYERIELDIS